MRGELERNDNIRTVTKQRLEKWRTQPFKACNYRGTRFELSITREEDRDLSDRNYIVEKGESSLFIRRRRLDDTNIPNQPASIWVQWTSIEYPTGHREMHNLGEIEMRQVNAITDEFTRVVIVCEREQFFVFWRRLNDFLHKRFETMTDRESQGIQPSTEAAAPRIEPDPLTQAAKDDPDRHIESVKRRLARHQANLDKLLEKAAFQGKGNETVDLLNQIEAEEGEIEKLKTELNRLRDGKNEEPAAELGRTENEENESGQVTEIEFPPNTTVDDLIKRLPDVMKAVEQLKNGPDIKRDDVSIKLGTLKKIIESIPKAQELGYYEDRNFGPSLVTEVSNLGKRTVNRAFFILRAIGIRTINEAKI